VAEQLDLVGVIDRVCGVGGGNKGPSLGEMVVAVAIQRACTPGPKRDLCNFLDTSIPRVSCLPGSAFTGQQFHRLAAQVDEAQLEKVQVSIAREAVRRFKLSTDVLAFDTTNFDTHIATTTAGELARRGHAKSKRSDLRVVGLGVLVSETGHVPLLYRSYPGNSSDQAVLESCLDGLGSLHDALEAEAGGNRAASRTLVRDGGFWSPQLELCLESTGFYSLISLPLSHSAAEDALQRAAKRGVMKRLSGKLKDVRAARFRMTGMTVGKDEVDRTLVVVESKELLEGQKRGIAAALVKARAELGKLEHLVAVGRIKKTRLEKCVAKALRREHLSSFVIAEVGGTEVKPTFTWMVDAERRRYLETTRLGRRVLCTDQHSWSIERVVHAFRGQWNVEEIFRRAKKGGIVPWGPSFQWADASLRVHTFATVLGLMLVSLARLALRRTPSTKAMMKSLRQIQVTLVRTTTGKPGRRPTVMLAPELTPLQRRAVRVFELERWVPHISSCSPSHPRTTSNPHAA
jgi:transposase